MTIEELKARAIQSMQEDLDTASDAMDYGDDELARKYRRRYFAKVDMYEAMFVGEYVYYLHDKVVVEGEVVD